VNEKTVSVGRSILAEPARLAEEFRARMTRSGTFVVNLMSSPGSGKTSLLEATARRLGDTYRLACLVGDIATDRDADRLRRYMPAVQLTTGGACRLEPPLVEAGFQRLKLDRPVDFLFIENVGNLVCPASFDLGEHVRVVVLAVTEGDDKPGKYPKAFRTSTACVLSKIDLLPYVPFRIDSAIADARSIRADLEFFPVSAVSGEGLDSWLKALIHYRNSRILNGCTK
jgi:hydrogenase nickel incorporation protein HypB